MTCHWNLSITSCCLNCLPIRAPCGLVLSSIKIGLSINRWLSKWGTTWHVKKSTPESYTAATEWLYPSRSRHEMQCFYAARLERKHPRCAIKIYIRLTNGLVSNYEYSNRDDHVTAFSEPADYVMTVPVVLLIALRTGAAHSAVCYHSRRMHELHTSIHWRGVTCFIV
jgi:hypothetical protein